MSFSHLLILGIIAVIVIPPEKLPEVARQVAKFLGEMRRMTSGVFDDLKQDMVLTPEDMLKKQQQKQQAQQQSQPASAEPKIAAAAVEKPKEITPEEKQKADDEYQKFIQGEPAPEKVEEKKLKND